jgi:hypothetical protein
VLPLHQRLLGVQPLHSFSVVLHPELQAIIVVAVPSPLHTTSAFPAQVRVFGLHVLHSNRTALHPCSQGVLVTAPSVPHTWSIAPMQVLLGMPQPEGPTSAGRPGVSAGDPVIASGGGGPSVSLC